MKEIGRTAAGTVIVEMAEDVLNGLRQIARTLQESVMGPVVTATFSPGITVTSGVVTGVPDPAPRRKGRAPRPSPAAKPDRICTVCGKGFKARTSAKVCSDACRKARASADTIRYQAKKAGKPVPSPDKAARLALIRAADRRVRAKLGQDDPDPEEKAEEDAEADEE